MDNVLPFPTGTADRGHPPSCSPLRPRSTTFRPNLSRFDALREQQRLEEGIEAHLEAAGEAMIMVNVLLGRLAGIADVDTSDSAEALKLAMDSLVFVKRDIVSTPQPDGAA